MSNCCEAKSCEVSAMKERHSGILKAVLVINLVMFFVESIGGLMVRSASLVSDSLDMLGDASVYALSLYAIGWTAHRQARVAQIKGWLMVALAGSALVGALMRYWSGNAPAIHEMSILGLAALMANLICVVLLFRVRSDNLNLRSTWICSRNDILANVAVLGAAGLVALTERQWPDLVVAIGIAALFLVSGMGVLKDAKRELRLPEVVAPRASA